jgi:hypothetical protein
MASTIIKNKPVFFTVILIIVIIFYLIYLNVFIKKSNSKEKFLTTSVQTTNQLLSDDLKSDEDYLQCINENNELQYKSNGKYNDCNVLLRDLSNWKMGPNTNIGFGALKTVCPISCLSKQPTQCLEKRLVGQDNTISNLGSIIKYKGNSNPQQIPSLDINLNTNQKYLDDLYNKKEISGIVNYIYKKNINKLTNDSYKEVLTQRGTTGTAAKAPTSRMKYSPIATPPPLIAFDPNKSSLRLP